MVLLVRHFGPLFSGDWERKNESARKPNRDLSIESVEEYESSSDWPGHVSLILCLNDY